MGVDIRDAMGTQNPDSFRSNSDPRKPDPIFFSLHQLTRSDLLPLKSLTDLTRDLNPGLFSQHVTFLIDGEIEQIIQSTANLNYANFFGIGGFFTSSLITLL